MLLFLLILSTVACSDIGLHDPDKEGVGVGSIFISTPTIDEAGRPGERKDILTNNINVELIGERETFSSRNGDFSFDKEFHLPNGSYEVRITPNPGERYYGYNFVGHNSDGEEFSFTKEGLKN